MVPDSSGFAALAHLLNVDPLARVVVSADSQPSSARALTVAGARAFLRKPVTPAGLRNLVRQELAGELE